MCLKSFKLGLLSVLVFYAFIFVGSVLFANGPTFFEPSSPYEVYGKKTHTIIKDENASQQNMAFISSFNNPPTIGELQSPSTVYANKFFQLNATINDADGTTDLTYVTIEISNGVIFGWANNGNTFRIENDPKGYSTLDPSGSTKTHLNSTAYELSWKVKLQWKYPEGSVSVLSGNTKVLDSQSDSETYSLFDLFYFEKDLVVYLTRRGIVTDGLVLFLAFEENEGINVKDVSGNNNLGIVYGADSTAGKIGNALHFDGMNNFINIPNSASLNPLDAITIETWAYADNLTTTAWSGLVSKGGYWGAEKGYDFLIMENALRFELWNPLRVIEVESGEILTGKWVHLTGSYDGSYMRLYINGKEVKSKEVNGSINENNTDTLFISARNGNDYFNGTIDELRIYNRCLNAGEIKHNFQEESKSVINPHSEISFKGWLYYEGTTIPPENILEISVNAELSGILRGSTTEISTLTGLFYMMVNAESAVNSYSYNIYTATPAGNSVQNQTVNVIVDKLTVMLYSDDRSDVNTTKTISWAVVRQYDGSIVSSCLITIYRDGTPWYVGMEMNKTDFLSTVGMHSYIANSVTDGTYGLTVFDTNTLSTIWDKVQITLTVINNRINIGTTMDWIFSAIYEYNGSPATQHVSVTLNDITTKKTQGKWWFTTSSIGETRYGLTAFSSNVISCTWENPLTTNKIIDLFIQYSSSFLVGLVAIAFIHIVTAKVKKPEDTVDLSRKMKKI